MASFNNYLSKVIPLHRKSERDRKGRVQMVRSHQAMALKLRKTGRWKRRGV